MTNITIGQYYPSKSFLHSLDPRVKLILIMALISVMFMLESLPTYGLVIIFFLFCLRLSTVPPSYVFKSLKGILFILLFTAFFNIFFGDGLYIAAMMAVRLILIVCFSSLLTLTTSPISLTNAIEALLNPLKVIKVPAHEIAMMMTIALRFIPTLLEETDKIMKAQAARGADFETGGLVKRAKALIPILVPLFFSSFRRAEELAVAMEARCYRGDYNRSKMKQMKLTSKDFVTIIMVALFIVLILALRRI